MRNYFYAIALTVIASNVLFEGVKATTLKVIARVVYNMTPLDQTVVLRPASPQVVNPSGEKNANVLGTSDE